MGASQRNKGSRAEREFINDVKDELGDFFGPMDKNWNQREETRYDLRLGPFGIEIKRQEKMALASWWGEAIAQTESTRIFSTEHIGGIAHEAPLMPMLVYRQNFKSWTIVLAMVDVIYLMTDVATNLKGEHTPAGHHDWHKHINFTLSMPLPAFAFFCREYLSPEVARGEAAP